MAVTLVQAKVGMKNKVYAEVIDSFRRTSILLDKLTFDNAVAPATGGSTLTYGYVQVKKPSYAEGRAINSEYTGSEAEKEEIVTTLKVLGGKFSIDRVLAITGGQRFTDEVAFQLEQKIKATVNKFTHDFIKGDSASVSTEFDGLDKLIINARNFDGYVISNFDQAMDATKAEAVCEALDDGISKCYRKPDVIIANSKTINKLKAAARLAGYKTQSEDAFGRPVDGYDGIIFVDLEAYYDSTNGETENVSDGEIYLVCLGLDAVHGVSPTENSAFISSRLPDYTTAGAVKDGDVELVTAIALKNARAAYKITITKNAAKTITATLTNGVAKSGNASTIAEGAYVKLGYTPATGKTLPTSVTVTGASSKWTVEGTGTSAVGTLELWNPTGNVSFTI